jgi:hypothetical protein
MARIQYQAFASQPAFFGGETTTEDKYHQPWSVPVRQKILPQLAAALIASGNIFTPAAPFPETVTESRFHYPWSEPVRFKQGLQAQYQQVSVRDFLSFPTSNHMAWYASLSMPVRLKPGLGVQLQQAFTIDAEILRNIVFSLQAISWWSEPVRLKIGLKAYQQQFLAMPPRLLPTPQVTLTMNALETNTDVALIGIYVYNQVSPATDQSGTRVSIVENPVDRGSAASIKET